MNFKQLKILGELVDIAKTLPTQAHESFFSVVADNTGLDAAVLRHFDELKPAIASGSIVPRVVPSKKSVKSVKVGVEEPAPYSGEDAPTPQTHIDISDWYSGNRKDKKGKKFLVNSTPRKPIGDTSYED